MENFIFCALLYYPDSAKFADRRVTFLDKEHKLNVQKTFRRRQRSIYPGDERYLVNVLRMFNLCPMPRGSKMPKGFKKFANFSLYLCSI